METRTPAERGGPGSARPATVTYARALMFIEATIMALPVLWFVFMATSAIGQPWLLQGVVAILAGLGIIGILYLLPARFSTRASWVLGLIQQTIFIVLGLVALLNVLLSDPYRPNAFQSMLDSAPVTSLILLGLPVAVFLLLLTPSARIYFRAPATLAAARTAQRPGLGPLLAAAGALIATAAGAVIWTVSAGPPNPALEINGTSTRIFIDSASVAAGPDGHRLYVASVATNTMAVLDSANYHAIARPITIGSAPHDIAVSPDGRRIYVTNGGDHTVSVIDATSDSAIGDPINVADYPGSVAVSPNGRLTYVLCRSGLSVMDTTDNRIVSTLAIHDPRGMAVAPDGGHIYVGDHDGRAVWVIDTATNNVRGNPFRVDGTPVGLAIGRDSRYLYLTIDSPVGDPGPGKFSVIDTATGSVVGDPITIGASPRDPVISSDGRIVAFVNYPSGDVTMVSTTTRGIVGAPISLGFPDEVAFSLDGQHVYISDDRSLWVIPTPV